MLLIQTTFLTNMFSRVPGEPGGGGSGTLIFYLLSTGGMVLWCKYYYDCNSNGSIGMISYIGKVKVCFFFVNISCNTLY